MHTATQFRFRLSFYNVLRSICTIELAQQTNCCTQPRHFLLPETDRPQEVCNYRCTGFIAFWMFMPSHSFIKQADITSLSDCCSPWRSAEVPPALPLIETSLCFALFLNTESNSTAALLQGFLLAYRTSFSPVHWGMSPDIAPPSGSVQCFGSCSFYYIIQ